MVKRWQRRCKMKISVPWPSGEQVHRIDLAIKDYTVLWEETVLKLTVDLERRIHALGAGGELLRKKDLVRLEKEYPIPLGLIRRQPVQIRVTPDYLVNVVHGENSRLEQGFYLHFGAWERKKKPTATLPDEERLLISGRVVEEEGVHIEMLDLPFLPGEETTAKLEAQISAERFILRPHGIEFQGKLLLSWGGRQEQSRPVSILIPQKVIPGRQVEGEAAIYMVRRDAGGKALLGVKIAWRMTKEEEFPVVVSPPGVDGCYSLCELEAEVQKVLAKELTLKLPEPARLLEEVRTGELRSAVMVGPKGLLFTGRLEMDLFYISPDGQEKCFQTHFPFEEWIAAAAEEREYRLEVKALRLNHSPLPAPVPGKELLLHLELDYCLTTLRRREVGLPPPPLSDPTRKILAEKIITHEALEYYVEIPLSRPPDFAADHQLQWTESVVEGRAEQGAVLLKVEPLLAWAYKNEQNQVKMVELKPVIEWVHPNLRAQSGQLVRVRLDGTQMKLRPESQGGFILQLLLTGKLTLSEEKQTAVRLPREAARRKRFEAARTHSLKWEEKLLFFPETIGAVHFFLQDFRLIKMEEAHFFEGKVGGLLTYRDRAGHQRLHRISKEVWLKIPATHGRNQIILPVLSKWECRPLPNWPWEQGGVWCELALRILSFPYETESKEVKM